MANPLAVFKPKLRGLKLEIEARAPGRQAGGPAVLASLAIEPEWLAMVHQGQFDAADREMATIVAKARGDDAEFVIREVHGLDLVYRKTRTGVLQLVLPKSHGLRLHVMLEMHSSLYSAHLGVRKTIAALQ